MFLRLFTYQCKIIFHVKELIFWTLLFPIALCTFMYLAFSNIFETTEKAGNIPVAIVAEQENAAASMMFEELSKGDEALLKVQKMTAEEADKALENGGVKGIYYTDSSLRLKVKETGMEQTILQMISKQYDQNKTLLMEVGSRHPEKLQEVIQTIQTQKSAVKEEAMGGSNPDNVVNYFYAIFAMTCLFASFSGCNTIHNIQPYTSELGRRKSVAPVSKMVEILSEFAAVELIQFALACLVLVYMTGILKINIGGHYGYVILLLFVGTSFGNTMGLCIGSTRLSIEAKTGTLVGVSLGLCFFADLMISGIRAFMQQHIPFFNVISPASLIVDSFYALNMDLVSRYWENIASLLILSVVLLGISIWLSKGGKRK